ncbi:hypothetical protein COHA_004180 [Chlorella ohadii]|uniref:Uncharacterized protein n=1 Tax=Chlorella ohadii TaxID=2649997 RepID=A0AAD5DR15_9CHLO|nr:hypothetical protein COHA_004180 [Chlorella ohadii]
MNELSERLQARGLTEEERQALQSQIVAKADEMRLLRQQLARGRAGSSSGSARRSSGGSNGGSEGGSDGDDGGGGSGSGKGGGGSGGAAREANAAMGGSSEEGNLSEADGDSDAAMPSSSEQKRGSKEGDGRAVAGGEGSDGEGSHNIEAAMRSSSEEGEGVAAMAGGEGSDGEGGHGASDGGSSVHTGEVQQMLFVGDDVDQEGAADDLAQQVAELGPVHMAQQQQQRKWVWEWRAAVVPALATCAAQPFSAACHAAPGQPCGLHLQIALLGLSLQHALLRTASLATLSVFLSPYVARAAVETPAEPGDKAAPMPTPLAAQPSCHHAHTSGKPATQLAFTYVARLAGAGARTSCCPLQPQCA